MNKNRKIFVIVIMAVIIIVIIFAIIKEQTGKKEERNRLELEQLMTIHEGIPDWMYTGKNRPQKIDTNYWCDESASEEWIEIELEYVGEMKSDLSDEYSKYSNTIKLNGGFWYLIDTENTIIKQFLQVEDWGVDIDYTQKNIVVSLESKIEYLYYRKSLIINWRFYETRVEFDKSPKSDDTIYIYVIDRLPIKDMGV